MGGVLLNDRKHEVYTLLCFLFKLLFYCPLAGFFPNDSVTYFKGGLILQ